ncbi:MFS multidrug transporter [Ilyonectria robusta]
MVLFLSCNMPENRPVSTSLSALKILREKVDFIGFLFFVGAAVQLFLALQFGGNQHAWNSTTIIGLFCSAGVTIIIFRISTDIICKPILNVQTFLPRPQIAIGTAFIMLGHIFGGAFSLSIAQTIFSNSLRTEIQYYAPEVNMRSIISAGATGIRKVASADSLPSILKAYSVAVNHVFYFTAAAGVCSFVFSRGLGWTDIRKKNPAE